jgi:hypothetical protein
LWKEADTTHKECKIHNDEKVGMKNNKKQTKTSRKYENRS